MIYLILSLFLNTAEAAKPKYGPEAQPRATTLAASHEYFRKNPSPDFWALIGYYTPQMNEAACSTASVTNVINAARALKPKTSDDKLLLQADVVEKVKVENWKKRVAKVGAPGTRGLTLDQLGAVTEATFREYGFPKAKATVVHVEASMKKRVLADLQQNEESAKDFIILNFNQQAFTDDADVGHIAPLGAYDRTNGRVLVLDPDRDWYEPYWVSVDTLISGMATLDKGAGKNRGYVIINTGE